MATAMVTAVSGSGGNVVIAVMAVCGNNGYRFLVIVNLIKVRKAYRQIKDVFCCTYNGLDGILFGQIMMGGCLNSAETNSKFWGCTF